MDHEITFERIDAARKLLQLPERASMVQIKAQYRALSRKWHPDRCEESPAQCQEMMQRINAAYKLILEYCARYEYSFSKEDVEHSVMMDDWWEKRFGDDPVWGVNQT